MLINSRSDCAAQQVINVLIPSCIRMGSVVVFLFPYYYVELFFSSIRRSSSSARYKNSALGVLVFKIHVQT